MGREVELRRFLSYVKRTRGNEIAEQCRVALDGGAGTDYFAVLREVTAKSPRGILLERVAAAFGREPVLTTYRRKPLLSDGDIEVSVKSR